jgi:hypothetical protein
MLNRVPKLPDVPFIVKQLQEEVSLTDISSIINCNRSTLSKIANESQPVPSDWFIVYRLIDLYLRKNGLPVPMYGDNNQL